MIMRHRTAVLALASALALCVGAAPPSSAADPVVFTSSGPITINDGGNATPYPAALTVSGLTAPITDVNVTLTGLSQDCVNELQVLVVGPGGQQTLLMNDVSDSNCQGSRAGGGDSAQNVTVTFDDAASGPVPDPLVSGTYKPTNGSGNPVEFPPPAPTGIPSANLSVFNGTTGNGTWNLFVRDRFGGPLRGDGTDVGSVSSGWRLSITTAAVAAADSTAPDTSFTKKPTYRHPRHSRFKVVSTEVGSTFRCRLDGGAPKVCGPTIDYVGLKRGKHTLQVAAVDAAGNQDATPATWTWKVWSPRTGHLPQ